MHHSRKVSAFQLLIYDQNVSIGKDNECTKEILAETLKFGLNTAVCEPKAGGSTIRFKENITNKDV